MDSDSKETNSKTDRSNKMITHFEMLAITYRIGVGVKCKACQFEHAQTMTVTKLMDEYTFVCPRCKHIYNVSYLVAPELRQFEVKLVEEECKECGAEQNDCSHK
jgi:hypothetical protein